MALRRLLEIGFVDFVGVFIGAGHRGPASAVVFVGGFGLGAAENLESGFILGRGGRFLSNKLDCWGLEPGTVSGRSFGTKMKSCQGRRVPALALSTSHSGRTTFMCLNSRTLEGVREHVRICVLCEVVLAVLGVVVDKIMYTRAFLSRYG